RPPSSGIQRALCREELRRAVREAGPPSGPDRRSLAIPASRPGHGAVKLDRHNPQRRYYWGEHQQLVWRAGAVCTSERRDAHGSGGLESLRTTRSDDGTLIPAAAAAANGATQVLLGFDDNRLASLLFGQYGQNLALIERRLGVVAEQRGNQVTIAGSRDA